MWRLWLKIALATFTPSASNLGIRLTRCDSVTTTMTASPPSRDSVGRRRYSVEIDGQRYTRSRSLYESGRRSHYGSSQRRKESKWSSCSLRRNLPPPCCQKVMGRERLSSNACGMRSREAMGYILCVAICRVRFHITKPTQSSIESARNIQPFIRGESPR
jgi:hypothetical protein